MSDLSRCAVPGNSRGTQSEEYSSRWGCFRMVLWARRKGPEVSRMHMPGPDPRSLGGCQLTMTPVMALLFFFLRGRLPGCLHTCSPQGLW